MKEDERLGRSVALVDGDIVLDGDPATGLALREVAGKANLLQALVLRVATPYGSDIFNTAYGLDVEQVFTQSAGLATAKALIRLNLVRTLGTDPRVREVNEVVFEDDPIYLARHPELSQAAIQEQRHRRTWRVDVVISTVDGQTATVPVSIGV